MTTKPKRLPAGAAPIRVISWIAVLAAMHAGQEILVPVALAILISFVLRPLVVRLKVLGLSNILAVISACTVAFGILIVLGVLVGWQLADLTAHLPDYRQNLVTKIRTIRNTEEGHLSRLTGTVDEIKKELTATTTPSTAPATTTSRQTNRMDAPSAAQSGGVGREGGAGGKGGAGAASSEPPVKVEVVKQSVDPFDALSGWLQSALAPFTAFAVVALLVVFILLYWDDTHRRMTDISMRSDFRNAPLFMDEVSDRLSSYLRAQLLINSLYGLGIGLGLLFLGVPNPILWGVVACVARFVPYVGPFLAAAFPILISIAAIEPWKGTFMTVGVFVIAEFAMSFTLEPWFLGSKAGVTGLGMVVSALFWGSLWGPVGVVLSVPMTVFLVAMGRHVSTLRYVTELFATEKPDRPKDGQPVPE